MWDRRSMTLSWVVAGVQEKNTKGKAAVGIRWSLMGRGDLKGERDDNERRRSKIHSVMDAAPKRSLIIPPDWIEKGRQ